MNTWQTETVQYLPRLEAALSKVSMPPPRPQEVPHGPLDYTPTPLQSVIHRATTFYELGGWLRTRETLEALICLWRDGYLSSAASLVRLLLELWAACLYMSEAIETYRDTDDLERLSRIVNRLFEGVRSDVLMPWGEPAAEKPIHVMDTIRALKRVFPKVEELYDDLCESAHVNQPRYFEWYLIGRLGDNWTNQTVKKRGHILLERTASATERSVDGIVSEISRGFRACGELYGAA